MTAVLDLQKREDVETYLKSLWMKQLKIKDVKLEDDFLQLGGQSVDLFRMLASIENDLDREIDFDDFFECTSLLSLRNVLLNLGYA